MSAEPLASAPQPTAPTSSSPQQRPQLAHVQKARLGEPALPQRCILVAVSSVAAGGGKAAEVLPLHEPQRGGAHSPAARKLRTPLRQLE